MFAGRECETKNGECMIYDGVSDFGDYGSQVLEQEFRRKLISRLKKCKSKEEENEVIDECFGNRLVGLVFSIVLGIAIVAIIALIVYLAHRYGRGLFSSK